MTKRKPAYAGFLSACSFGTLSESPGRLNVSGRCIDRDIPKSTLRGPEDLVSEIREILGGSTD
jgi:hypothetical protein